MTTYQGGKGWALGHVCLDNVDLQPNPNMAHWKGVCLCFLLVNTTGQVLPSGFEMPPRALKVTLRRERLLLNHFFIQISAKWKAKQSNKKKQRRKKKHRKTTPQAQTMEHQAKTIEKYELIL